MTASAADVVEDVARTSYGRLVAYLASTSGDLAAAEDAMGDALLAALQTWPERGVPERPESWLVTAARRRLVDAARHRDVVARALPSVALLLDEQATPTTLAAVPDKRLELLFACASPAVPAAVRSPLMLQAVLGVDAARMSSAFLVPASTMGQRLVRAKAAVRDSGAAFALPDRDALPERLQAVLDAVHVAYGTGWEDPAGLDPGRSGLADEAVRLARLLVELLPDEPEARGLLALLLHTSARAGARRGPNGAFVPLAEQDPARWSRELVEKAEEQLAVAVRAGRPGPYQLQAAIQSVHNLRAATGRTDWQALEQLYDGLVTIAPTVGAQVARAAVLRSSRGPDLALHELDALSEKAVRSYQPYWVLRARCLADLGDPAARHAGEVAVGLTADPAVRAHLVERLDLGR